MKRYQPIFSENKREKFLEDLIENTKEGKVIWKSIATNYYDKYIYHSDQIVRLFESSFKNNKFVAVEKKMPMYVDDFERYIDFPSFELCIFDEDNNLKTNIDESNASKNLLNQLFISIEDVNLDIDNIF